MTLDPQLLQRARTAADAVTRAERDVVLARADYHTAVRRLHLAGGTLREVAAALGLSHQRVQQMVGGAGGTWWSRAWRSRTRRRDATCTFCGLPPAEVEKLIAGPNVYICDACVTLAERVAEGFRGDGRLIKSTSAMARCSFCGKRRTTDRQVVAGGDARVCGECLQVCRQILDGGAV
jgi:hypothetical protein